MNARALPLYATILIFVVAYALAYSQFPNILSTRVIGNLLTDNAYLGIVAVGTTLVITAGWCLAQCGPPLARRGVRPCWPVGISRCGGVRGTIGAPRPSGPD